MPRLKTSLVGVLLAAILSCSSSGSTEDEPSAGEAAAVAVSLSPTLVVRVAGDTVRFVLRVANGGTTPVTMAFQSAQRYDFVVRDGSGAEVWRWSADQGFAQMLGEETVEAGGELEYEASWLASDRSGTYEAVGQLVSRSHPVELRTEFVLGEG